MDQKKTGLFLKELRKEKEMTQSQLAEQFGVSDRTVSRWETGSNMPDLSLLVELADFYNVDIKEIICGERKSGTMEKEEKETLQMVADYAENEKKILLKRVRFFDIFGVVSMMLAFILANVGMDETEIWQTGTPLTNCLVNCLYGFTLGVLIMNLLYVTGVLAKVRENPKRRRISKIIGVVSGCIVIASIVLSAMI